VAPGPSWRTEPARAGGRWLAYREVDPRWPPLYRGAGEAIPTQESGRWHRQGHGYAQYMSLDATAAWAELIRREEIRDEDRRRAARRNLWRITVEERDIADLSTFEKFEACGLDPRLAVGSWEDSHRLAEELRRAGYRGLLTPSAALPDAVNLTVFGERYEVEISTGEVAPGNPDPGLWYPVVLVAPSTRPPRRALEQTCYRGEPHPGLERWRKERRSA
jgi:RES domain